MATKFVLSNKGDIIVQGSNEGSVSLDFIDGILWVLVEGEPSGDDLQSCIKQALDAGVLGLNMNTIVDVTRFTGTVDWQAVRAIKDLAPWGTGGIEQPRIAYIARDDVFGMLIRIICALFPRCHHRLFLDKTVALEWLEAPKAGRSCSGRK
jgi:hypothetical protein